MISETVGMTSQNHPKTSRVLDAKGQEKIKINQVTFDHACSKPIIKPKKRRKACCKNKLKIVNKNQNLQVVNMKLGCGKKKVTVRKRKKTLPRIVRRIAKKIVHVPVVSKVDKNFLTEKICVDFLVQESKIPQRLWTAIGVKPTGSLVLDNKSPKSMTLIIHRADGEVITQEVKPQTELSLTVENLVLIEATCNPVPFHPAPFIHAHSSEKCSTKPSSCFGELRLHLFIPLQHECPSTPLSKCD